jgi:hypothetical protein
MSELEPPPDELMELFAAERTAPTVDTSTRMASRARLAAAVAGAPLGYSTAGVALASVAKIIATIAIIVAIGAGTAAFLRHARSAPTPKAPAIAAIPEESIPAPHVEVATSPAPLPAEPSPPRVASPPAPSEADLLRRAWTALSAGQAALARQLVEQDAKLHPDGTLGEERDAVEILALAQLDRMEEARAAGARFIQHYPTSVHRARIERTIAEEKP